MAADSGGRRQVSGSGERASWTVNAAMPARAPPAAASVVMLPQPTSLTQGVDEQAEADGRPGQPPQAGRRDSPGGQVTAARDDPGGGDRQVDDERPAPAEVADEHAADGVADDAARRTACRPETERAAAAAPWGTRRRAARGRLAIPSRPKRPARPARAPARAGRPTARRRPRRDRTRPFRPGTSGVPRTNRRAARPGAAGRRRSARRRSRSRRGWLHRTRAPA